MCLRYSSSVVAPTARSSPRASIGLSRLAASTAPSAAPAPTIVCSSSMKRMIWPWASATSLSTALSRSSNSPRYFAPATSAPMSSAITAPVAQRLGHVAGDDALGEALDDRGLADAGLADQDGVVLRAAGEDLDHAADLVVAADDRVELALLGGLGEVAPEPLERLVLVLGVLVGHAVRAADLLDGLARAIVATAPASHLRVGLRARAAGARWRRTRRPCRAPRRRRAEQLDQPAVEAGRLGRVAADGRQGVERLVRAPPNRLRIGARAAAAPARRCRPPARAAPTSRWCGATCGLRRAPASRWAAARASWDLMVKRSACMLVLVLL